MKTITSAILVLWTLPHMHLQVIGAPHAYPLSKKALGEISTVDSNRIEAIKIAEHKTLLKATTTTKVCKGHPITPADGYYQRHYHLICIGSSHKISSIQTQSGPCHTIIKYKRILHMAWSQPKSRTGRFNNQN